MKLTQDVYPHATLPEDRVGLLELNGSGNMVLSKNPQAIWVRLPNAKQHLRVDNWYFVGLHGGTRVARFFRALPAVWRFCK